jgi:hypothetical protein
MRIKLKVTTAFFSILGNIVQAVFEKCSTIWRWSVLRWIFIFRSLKGFRRGKRRMILRSGGIAPRILEQQNDYELLRHGKQPARPILSSYTHVCLQG